MDNNPNLPNESQPPAEGQPNFDARSYSGPQQPYGSNPGYPPPYGYGQQPPPGYGQYYNAYVPSNPTGPMLSTPTGIYPLAGFWIRFGALIIDSIILMIAGSFLGLIMTNANTNTPTSWVVGAAYAIGFIAIKGSTPGMMACGLRVIRAEGTLPTLGTAVGRYFASLLFQFIGLVILIGSVLFGLGSLFLDYFNRYGSTSNNSGYFRDHPINTAGLGIAFIGILVAIVVLCFDYVWAAWDPRKQTLHDKMAHTFVIKSRS